MSENSFAAAHQKLNESHLQQLERKYEYDSKRQAAIMRAWDLQMRCYINGNQECVHEYDKLFIEQQHITRECIAVGRKCVNLCEENGTGFEQGTQVFDNESLNLTRKFYSCIKPCIERSIEYTNSEIKLIDKTIRVVSEYLKG